MLQREAKMKGGSDVSEKDADDWEGLASEITQIMLSEKLSPTMHTQHMRTTFQIPYDATALMILDANLHMISEPGYDAKNGEQ